ncbi:AlbA family DNA-binding domain-containing protein [Tsukamurella soli]|uniref:AlbA family DNA-binding domain-containing protein n=1 Tax=Tsukamurella soli TaxID=644556 RepID=UPI0036219CAD
MTTADRLLFTPLHRALGADPSPLTFALLTQAVDNGIPETADLDFKQNIEPGRALKDGDLPKDLAAMANSGGGMLLFGVSDSGSTASGVSPLTPDRVTDTFVRDIRRIALNQLSPPLFDLDVVPIVEGENRALVVIVPNSAEAPHFIFKDDSFKVPYRHGPDTQWMNERMLEAAYRARFEQFRTDRTALDELVEHGFEGRPTDARAWLVAASRPSTPSTGRRRLTKREATEVFLAGHQHAQTLAPAGNHPLARVDVHNPRTGLRKWRASPATWRRQSDTRTVRPRFTTTGPSSSPPR